MGWKNVKEYYGIKHIVHVSDGDICIGSPYISKIIVISPEGTIVKRHAGGNEDLSRIQKQMNADACKLRELIEADDVFSKSITVYMFEGERIFVDQCEELGWPNVTHGGRIMRDDCYFLSRQDAVQHAKRETTLNVRMYRRLIKEKEKEIERLHTRILCAEANMKRMVFEHALQE